MSQPLALDDLQYDDLVLQARGLIPSLCPQWTDHNPSDPGIALVELFAWLTEMMVYRLNRVPEQSYRTFLTLLSGSSQQPGVSGPPVPLEDAIRTTISTLRDIDRAITPDDIAYLLLKKWPASPDGIAWSQNNLTRVRRVRCEPGRPLIFHRAMQLAPPSDPNAVLVGKNTFVGVEPEDRVRLVPADGHLTAVVLSEFPNWPDAAAFPADPNLIALLETYLEPRRLLTSHLHVIGPRVLQIGISAELHLSSDGIADKVRADAEAAIWAWLHPLTGGPDGTGWPFGRPINLSDLYELLDNVPGLEFVEAMKLTIDGQEQPGGVDISEFEVVAKDSVDFKLIGPDQAGS